LKNSIHYKNILRLNLNKQQQQIETFTIDYTPDIGIRGHYQSNTSVLPSIDTKEIDKQNILLSNNIRGVGNCCMSNGSDLQEYLKKNPIPEEYIDPEHSDGHGGGEGHNGGEGHGGLLNENMKKNIVDTIKAKQKNVLVVKDGLKKMMRDKYYDKYSDSTLDCNCLN
jgi:hypothetical protein